MLRALCVYDCNPEFQYTEYVVWVATTYTCNLAETIVGDCTQDIDSEKRALVLHMIISVLLVAEDLPHQNMPNYFCSAECQGVRFLFLFGIRCWLSHNNGVRRRLE